MGEEAEGWDKATGLFQAQMIAEIGRRGGTCEGGEKGSDSGCVLKVVEIWRFEVLMREETFCILALGG